MDKVNIIGFCGRLQSGKSTLASICEEFGYKKLYFAQPLKQLCADILDVSIEELNRLKVEKTIIDLEINDDICDIISVETEIPLTNIKELSQGRIISDVRDLLQFVGTDIIRRYNTNWHVNKIREMINPNEKYVFDDVRFPNEKSLIEELNGDLWFVVRPNLTNVSNHISETSIKWQDIDNIIVNDKSLSYLKNNWEIFMKSGYEKSFSKRQEIKEHLLGISDLIENTNDTTFTMLDSLCLSIWEFLYKKISFNEISNIEINSIKNNMNILTFYQKDENNINVLKKIKNPLNIEDYKFKLFEIQN